MLIAENPEIFFDVISTTTGHNDRNREVAGHFRIDGVRHDLIVDHGDRLVAHHEWGPMG